MKGSSGSPILWKILSENRFSGKTYFYIIASRPLVGARLLADGGHQPGVRGLAQPSVLAAGDEIADRSRRREQRRQGRPGLQPGPRPDIQLLCARLSRPCQSEAAHTESDQARYIITKFRLLSFDFSLSHYYSVGRQVV